ncbi:Nucleotide-binding universal stress protein, UspA family [Peptoclostridium litorale DSM 5388]|uniref:UspA domain-containing protein n=1 Tax=Peptoclostridium litorale DSM 5388 TaxID=1121324 RepID=A0A069RCE8_PEPLI|nr:universal stress protein [Peptoclostridium litorale]KDR94719.1 hypothetical protein CLIT_13c00410 [Peptoclostridium litorale DSM 5388]SIO33074.1 Nucleotide-binding universal stress protein, UspA family [Peptoclostridium litorale DSM 5388]
MDINKILLPVDGSEIFEIAAQKAIEIASAYDSEIFILNVENRIEREKYSAHTQVEFKLEEDAAREQSKKILEDAKNFFRQSGLKVSTTIKKGNPAAVIIDMAEEEGFDLVIMCSRGLGSGKRFLLGSVAKKVVYQCNVPVLIAK